MNGNRDVDGEPVNLDDDVCQQILRTAESLNYVELFDGDASVIGVGTSSQNDVDVDTSTPDHMTSNSDPDVVQVFVNLLIYVEIWCFFNCRTILYSSNRCAVVNW